MFLIFSGTEAIAQQPSLIMVKHMAMQLQNTSKITDQMFYMPHMIHCVEEGSFQHTTHTNPSRSLATEVETGIDGYLRQNIL